MQHETRSPSMHQSSRDLEVLVLRDEGLEAGVRLAAAQLLQRPCLQLAPTTYSWEKPLVIWSDPRLPDQDYVRKHAKSKPRWMLDQIRSPASPARAAPLRAASTPASSTRP